VSRIEWTDKTWNPVRGCTRVSPGCEHCYAERFLHRFNKPGLYAEGLTVIRSGAPGWSGKIDLVESELDKPVRWKKPRRVFVCSVSDLFHPKVPFDYIDRVFQSMMAAPQHTYQILTKRPERMVAYFRESKYRDPMPWVWLGTSAEDQEHLDRRLPALVSTQKMVPSAKRFLSCEPLLGMIRYIDLRGVDWVIVGGESGPGARPMEAAWVRHLRDRCVQSRVPFFFKQWGGVRKSEAGRELDGRTWDQYPGEVAA